MFLPLLLLLLLLPLSLGVLTIPSPSSLAPVVTPPSVPPWRSYLGDKPAEFWDSLDWLQTEAYLPPNKKPQYLYSVTAMRKLARIEVDIYRAFKIYVQAMETRLRVMKEFITDYEESSVYNMHPTQEKTQLERDYVAVANPIVGHRLIRRFAVEFQWIQEDVERCLDIDLKLHLKRINPDRLLYPNDEEDYQLSLLSITRIQQYSLLEPRDLASGIIGDLSTPVGLGAKHAFDLGVYARKWEHRLIAERIEWLEIAMEKAPESSFLLDDSLGRVKDELDLAVLEHDQVCKPVESNYFKESCFLDLIGKDYGVGRNRSVLRRKNGPLKRNTSGEVQNMRSEAYYADYIRTNFRTTCAGVDLRNASETSKLFCWYERKRHPYLTIAPFKFEQISEEPEVWQIYDVISPNKTNAIIKRALPYLWRSFVVDDENGEMGHRISKVRTSVQTWLTDDDQVVGPSFLSIGKQIEYATGLHVINSSEQWQVASYRISHHYDEHTDGFVDEKRGGVWGNRIATFMFYLTEVEEGGYTGFPYVGYAARPVPGSVVFWYNFWKDGKHDMRSYHGGCPIVHGVKWIMNKWIQSHKNFRRRPCDLKESA